MKKYLPLTLFSLAMLGFILLSDSLAYGNIPAVPIPADNPQTAQKIELGRQLFFDERLSSDNSTSCASCHKPEFAFSDGGKAVSEGVEKQQGTRNAPSLTNVAFRTTLFWDQRATTLEEQAEGPLTNPIEMNMDAESLAAKLAVIPEYKNAFQTVFAELPNLQNIAKAIAAFERTLISFSSPYDQFLNVDRTVMSEAALRGFGLFFGEKGDCFHCHAGADLTDGNTHNTALAEVYSDNGKGELTGQFIDMGKFKTPTLRNIALTAPYMHDGSLETLRDVVEHYNKGGFAHPAAAPLMRPLDMSDDEVDDLIAFLEALTDESFIHNPSLADPNP